MRKSLCRLAFCSFRRARNEGGMKTLEERNARAMYLRNLWDHHVVEDPRGWKCPCAAMVPAMLAADVAEAMGYFGAVVDRQESAGGFGQVSEFTFGAAGQRAVVRASGSGNVLLYSHGYYHHIGA